MNLRAVLLATVAATSMLAGTAHAAPAKKHHAAARSANQELLQEVRSLRSEVENLKQQMNEQTSAQVTTQHQVATTTAQVQSTAAQVEAVQAQVASTPPVTNDQVKTQIASAIEKEHHNDKFYFKGITITPGGFLELSGIYRNHFQGDDIASSFNIPFPGQSHAANIGEGRFSARQSRVSFLAQGKPDAHTTLAMYGEFDFQGGAQTSNSNQSNSYVPRIRNLYGTLDWDKGSYGIHVLAGQNWSLLTMQGKGISPRSEVTPPQIDAQYVPGFAWARQPGVRVAVDFDDHKLWLAASAENAQTTFGGTGIPAGITSAILGNGSTAAGGNQVNPAGSFQQFYNGVGSSLSLSNVPDFIGKAAYEDTIAGHTVHIEGFGIYRTFNTHIDGTSTNQSAHGFGYGGSIAIGLIPKVLDLQFSGIGGKGIGRYGSAGLADVTSDKEGNLHALKEFMLLAGATLHATKRLDLYAFAGEEQEKRQLYDGGTSGYGVPTADNSGCFVESATTTNFACGGNTRRIRQITGGAWDKIYMGSFGRAQVGIQYSYTQRQLFEGTGASLGLPVFDGRPQADNNMVFVAFRYYPF
jgi:hypothetical protein